MTRAVAIASALTPEQCAELKHELAKVLPRSDEAQRAAFTEVAGEEIDVFLKLLKPAEHDDALYYHRLEKLAQTARAFAKAVHNLDDSLHQLVEGQLARQVPSVIFQCDLGSPAHTATAGAAEAAIAVSDVAAYLLSRRRSHPGPKVGGAIPALIAELACAYVDAFKMKPSPSKEGRFMRVLHLLLQIAEIDAEVGETRLRGILKRTASRRFPDRAG